MKRIETEYQTRVIDAKGDADCVGYGKTLAEGRADFERTQPPEGGAVILEKAKTRLDPDGDYTLDPTEYTLLQHKGSKDALRAGAWITEAP